MKAASTSHKPTTRAALAPATARKMNEGKGKGKEKRNSKGKLTREKIDTGVADSLHKYGLDLSPTKKVEDLTLFENTLYQNALWKQMIYNPNSFKDLRGKLNVCFFLFCTQPVRQGWSLTS